MGLYSAIGRYVDFRLNYGWQLRAAPGMPDRGQFFELAALARIDQQGRALDRSAGLHMQFAERGDQGDRKVVDTIEAEIFKCFEDGAFSGTAKAGEDHQLAGVARRSALHAGRPTP